MSESLVGYPARRELLGLGKNHLFKGLTPSLFEHYFNAGGITPHPDTVANQETWISNDVFRALEFSGAKRLGNGTCFAVIDGAVVSRGSLRPQMSLQRVLSRSLRDYSGDEHIAWNDLLRLFVVPESLEQIEASFKRAESSTTSWDEFKAKIQIIPPGMDSLQSHLMQFLRSRTK